MAEKSEFGRGLAIRWIGKIVGIGDNLLDVYDEAKEKTSKTRFAFRRVGHSYIYKYRGETNKE